MKYIQEFSTALAVSIVLGILVYFKKQIPVLWRKAAARRFRKVIAYESAKHSIVQNMQSVSKAKRVVLCKAHNGGGVPKQGKEIRITIDLDEFDQPLTGIKSEWQSRSPDYNHLMLLLELTRNRKQKVYSEKTETEVRYTHLADGITYSYMREVVPTSTAYWYIVFFYTEDKQLCDEEKRKLSSLNDKLKQVLSNKATLLDLELWAKSNL